jgi:hypothetical protein
MELRMKRKCQLPACCLLCCCTVLLSGCSRATAVKIGGKVTWQGKPVDQGVICFLPEDGQGGAVPADIKNGRYDLTVPFGPKRVEISSVKVTGQRKVMMGAQPMMMDVREELLPEQFNKKSTLRVDISANSGNKDVDFVL